MNLRRVVPGLHQIQLAGVNAFLLEGATDGLVLVDAGVRGSAGQILGAARSLGYEAQDLRHILVTHCHPDHTGALAELKAATGARVFMHRSDASLLVTGRVMRRLVRTPGPLNAVLYRTMIAASPVTVDPVDVDELLDDRTELPLAGGISVIHTPGHTEGHVVFLARAWSAAIVGDAAANLFGLRPMIAYEHLGQGLLSVRHLSRFDFEVACFGHGSPIRPKADRRFRRRWRPRGARA